nr:hypothetical protein [uncultured Halomonas sp.]
MGPSKNASAYRFHAYKWSYHHIPWIFDAVLMFPWENMTKGKLDFLSPEVYAFSHCIFGSTYYASGGKNPYLFVFSGCKTQNYVFFRLSLQRWVSISGFFCA